MLFRSADVGDATESATAALAKLPTLEPKVKAVHSVGTDTKASASLAATSTTAGSEMAAAERRGLVLINDNDVVPRRRSRFTRSDGVDVQHWGGPAGV